MSLQERAGQGEHSDLIAKMTRDRKLYRFPLVADLLQRFGRGAQKAPAFARLPERAIQIWKERNDLQTAFDLDRTRGRIGLFWWCLLHGFREMGLRFQDKFDAEFRIVNEPLPQFPHAGFTPVTWLMRALWEVSSHREGSLRDSARQRNWIAHYFSHALLDANLGGLLSSENGRLLREDDPESGIPRLFGLIWQCDPKLASRFSSPTSAEFISWCSGEAARHWPILAHPLVALAPSVVPKKREGRFEGVNLFGHALGRFGIGEDLRMAALSLEAAGIPYVIRNVAAATAGEEEGPGNMKISPVSRFDVNLFCMTGISTVETQFALRDDVRDGRHTIGLWPWELPEWPQAWCQAWDTVDEVWATSHFTYGAYARAAQAPLYHMPMAVQADACENLRRSDFGLRETDFLFGFSFDGLSSLARKNPIATVTAFRRAFSPEERGVGLVLKGIRGDASASAWQALTSAIGDDNRIHVINESMSRGRLLDLYRSLDAFISLHRSEGFGRNIAEAMLLKKPVIVSAHSGNLDFTRHDNAVLVPTRLCTVQQGEYAFGAGQRWGDPDVDAAALAMRRMVEDRAWRERIASAGETFIRENYSPGIVGKAWARRLLALS